MATPELSTHLVVDDELVLGELEEHHAIELFHIVDRNRAYLRECLPWLDHVRSAEDNLRSIRRRKQLRADRTEIGFGVFLRGELVGFVATHTLDWTNRKTTLGFWIGAEFSGQGLIVRSCHCLLEYLFEELQFHRIGIYCATGNQRSRRVAEKLGFRLEGILKESEFLYDHYVDQVVYGLLRDEFRSLNRSPDNR